MENVEEKMVWIEQGDMFMPVQAKINDSIPAGAYYFCGGGPFNGPSLTKLKYQTDKFVALDDEVRKTVEFDIAKFWDEPKRVEDAGFLRKRGILLWGPPGTGKTVIIQQVASWGIEKGAIVLDSDDAIEIKRGIHLIRQVEPERPIIVLMEELDTYNEGDLLPVLDGAHQYGNIIYLATTNYPERLTHRLKNRPSRFPLILYVDFPNESVREQYLTVKSPHLAKNEVERKKWVSKTKGMSIDHLKELVISVECFGIPFDEAIERISTMWNDKSTSAIWESKMVHREA